MFILPTQSVAEGDGSFMVERAFPNGNVSAVDPFLLLDHFGPHRIAEGSNSRLPPHPHRGFETLTYMLEGQIEHADTAGNTGLIGPGEVQWMTAGGGIVHSETPMARPDDPARRLHGIQLWINLPAADKMAAPRYQELSGDTALPMVDLPDGAGTARVIAGAFGGAQATGQSFTPLQIVHLRGQGGHDIALDVPAHFVASLYMIDGSATLNGAALAGKQLGVVGPMDGTPIELTCGADGADFLLLAGAPIGEPIARGGPFVMNTRAQVLQAFEDYKNGTLQTGPVTQIS